MHECPAVVGGARVVCFTPIDDRHRHTANTRQIVAGVVLGPAAGLVIGRYEGEAHFYLFGCDEQWQALSDTWHATLDDAKQQAEFEYRGSSQTWTTVR